MKSILYCALVLWACSPRHVWAHGKPVEGKPAWQQPPVERADKAGDDDESKEVTFQSDPSGAQVQINGTIACTTPCSVFMPNYYFEMKGKDSASSKHRETPMIARFSKDGYVTEIVQLTAGPYRSEIPGSTPNYDYYVIVRTNVSTQLHAAPIPIPERQRSTVEPPATVVTRASTDLEKEATPQQWFDQGLARFNKGDQDGAIRDYNEAILRKPDYAAAFNERGNALYHKGDLDGALKDYGEAIRLKPDYAAALYNRGNVRRDKDDFDNSVKDYDEAIRLKPSSADAFNNRGLARQNKGDLDGALKDYSEAIRLRPDMVQAFNNRAIVLRRKGDLDGAIRDYNEAIRLKPDMAEAFNNRAVVRQDKGDVDGGLEDCNEAIRLRPGYAAAFYNRANLRRSKGDLDGAQRDYQEALRLGFKPIH